MTTDKQFVRNRPPVTSGLYPPNREQRCGQTALNSRSRRRVNAPTLRGGDDNEDNAVSPQPYGPMGVAGDIFVASRRRCEYIDFPLAPCSPRQDPSALLPIRGVQVTAYRRSTTMFESTRASLNNRPSSSVVARSRRLPLRSSYVPSSTRATSSTPNVIC